MIDSEGCILGPHLWQPSSRAWGRPGFGWTQNSRLGVGSFPLTVTVDRSYKNPLNKAPLRTVTGRGNDPSLGLKGYKNYTLGIWRLGILFRDWDSALRLGPA